RRSTQGAFAANDDACSRRNSARADGMRLSWGTNIVTCYIHFSIKFVLVVVAVASTLEAALRPLHANRGARALAIAGGRHACGEFSCRARGEVSAASGGRR